MPFSPSDFRELVQLLEEHPEWRGELRRLLLTDEVLELPELVRQLVEAQTRTEARVAALAEAQARTEAQVAALAQAQARAEAHFTVFEARTQAQLAALTDAQMRTEARVEALAEQMGALAARVGALTEAQMRTEARLDAVVEGQRRIEERLHRLDDRVGRLDGAMLEIRSERRAHSYFGRLAKRLKVIDPSSLATLLDDAVEAKTLTEGERDAILWADLVLSGRRREDQAEIYLLVEVSVGIGLGDVQRSQDRAASLAKLGRPVVPVVAGNRILPEALAAADAGGVRYVLVDRDEDKVA